MNDQPYTREELLLAENMFPAKGLFCPRCKTYIPQFQDLTPANEKHLKQLIADDHRIQAMKELKNLTGCSLGWAKIWVLHPSGPEPLPHQTTPCPYCGRYLRTKVSKQCRHCKRDWHNPDNVTQLPDC